MLFSVRPFSDLFADTCVIDASGALLFLSLYGRDTSVQQLLAAFTLPSSQGGVDRITLNDPSGRQVLAASIGNGKDLQKLAGRLPSRTIFGEFSHVFVYQPGCKLPDHANKQAWLLTPTDVSKSALIGEVWALVKELSPLPLLEHWRDQLIEALRPLSGPQGLSVGKLEGRLVRLGEDFEQLVSGLVRDGKLAESMPKQGSGVESQLRLCEA